MWEKMFEVDVLKVSDGEGGRDKFFGNFLYLYMNGLLYFGYVFLLSKLEFASAYYRLKGDWTLFLFVFYCMGMLIKVCVDKIVKEIVVYGNLFVFFDVSVMEVEVEVKVKAEAANAGSVDSIKFVVKKLKVMVKKGM